MTRAVMIIEDEVILAKNIKTWLERHGYEALVCNSGEEGLKRLDAFQPDVLVLDYHLPNMHGLAVLAQVRTRAPRIKVIMITGNATVEVAVQAMKAGAFDYLAKPVVLGELKLLVDRALGQERVETTLDYMQARQASNGCLSRLLGESPPMRALKDKILRLAAAEAALADDDLPAVLITGETGTGKEVVARAVHFQGPRKAQPFIELNCAAIPAHLLEAELFGYERGAFTDARERKYGLVEAADGGTLFLDEIGELDLPVQIKLLKVLEEKTVRRLGGLRENRINFRIIAATNQDLQRRVDEGKFRSDLYYRLRMVQMPLPALRERDGDILLLAHAFLATHGARYRKPHLVFSPAAEDRLQAWHWPGNVRELRNMLEQVVLMAQDDTIGADELPFPGQAVVREAAATVMDARQPLNLEGMERQFLTEALARAEWNVTHAARMLGLSRDTLRYRMEKYNIRTR
jgi:two-component system response regulator AtoC